MARKVADMMDAGLLINLTDVDGVFNRYGRLVRLISGAKDLIEVRDLEKSKLGNGGMKVKIENMMEFARNNRVVYIANGNEEDILLKILGGFEIGTRIQL